jgi:cobalt-precorrin 5A hydrolase
VKTALLTLSREGAVLIEHLVEKIPEAQVFLHDQIEGACSGQRFKSIIKLTAKIFKDFQGFVYIMPTGVVVRALAPHIQNKKTDPAVVVVDAGGRYVLSLLSGHEGGANELALRVGNILGAEPIITTTTEALKNIIVGIGCRRGISADRVVRAVEAALKENAIPLEQVRYLASADIKADESGLLEAAERLGLPLRFISSEEIRSTRKNFEASPWVRKKVNLPAVAEPTALLAGRRTQLLAKKKSCQGVTVALARENFLWSASVPEDR